MPPAKKAAAKKAATPAKKAAAPARKAAPAKAAVQATITLKQIAADLAESHDLPKKQAEAVLSDWVSLTSEHLKKGDKIRLSGLGILQVRALPARKGRNPATGEAIEIGFNPVYLLDALKVADQDAAVDQGSAPALQIAGAAEDRGGVLLMDGDGLAEPP